MKRKMFGLFLLTILLLCLCGAEAAPDFTLLDTASRPGSWAEAYTAVLEERGADIQAYQDYVLSVTSIPSCSPVGLRDLTGDGVPELFFIDLSENTEYGFKTGRFWIYTFENGSAHCALTLRPEIDELLYSSYYLAQDGVVTIHFSDTEMGWVTQLRLDPAGHYQAETILNEVPDFSGMIPDEYFLNGTKITGKKYQAMLKQIQSGEGTLFGSLMVDDGGSGFGLTLAEARVALAAGNIPQAEAGSSGAVSGKYPELAFVKGSFTPGQKFAVYSAPSEKSLRAANGKAAITSGSEIFVAGTDGGWVLILYELASGVTRVGYIDSKTISGDYTAGEELSFSGTTVKLAESAEITDDPIRKAKALGKLKKGSQVTVLAAYRGWIYVEAKVSGKTARGFIAPSSLETAD